MSDDAMRCLEMALEYIQAAIRYRRFNGDNDGDTNLTRAITELQRVDDERAGCGSEEIHS